VQPENQFIATPPSLEFFAGLFVQDVFDYPAIAHTAHQRISWALEHLDDRSEIVELLQPPSEFDLMFQFDFTRAPANPQKIKSLLPQIKALGYRQVTFYTETIPGMGNASHEPVTYQDYQDIITAAISAGLEPFASIELLGHFKPQLQRPGFGQLGLNGRIDTLNPDHPEAAALVSELIDNSLRPFHEINYQPRFIHVGFDEAPLVSNAALVRHIEMVFQKCQERGVLPLFWGDELKRLTGEEVASLKHKLDPENRGLWQVFAWQYDITDPHQMADFINNLTGNGLPLSGFAVGSQVWEKTVANIPRAQANTKAALDALRHCGLTPGHIMMTNWNDSKEAAIETAFPAWVYLAALSSGMSETDAAQTSRRSFQKRGFNLDLLIDLDQLDEEFGNNDLPPNLSRTLLYSPSWVRFRYNGFSHTNLATMVAAHYRHISQSLESEAAKMPLEMLEANLIAQTLRDKNLWGNRAYEAYQANARDSLQTCLDEIPQIVGGLASLWYVSLLRYQEEYRSDHQQFLTERFQDALWEWSIAQTALRSYLNGESDTINLFSEREYALNRRWFFDDYHYMRLGLPTPTRIIGVTENT